MDESTEETRARQAAAISGEIDREVGENDVFVSGGADATVSFVYTKKKMRSRAGLLGERTRARPKPRSVTIHPRRPVPRGPQGHPPIPGIMPGIWHWHWHWQLAKQIPRPARHQLVAFIL